MPEGLYYLDNLESVAESPEGQEALRAMRELPGVRLLVSSRVSLPALFGQPIVVGALPTVEALQLFRDSWGGSDPLPVDGELKKFVVEQLGAHALSVTLTARLGDCYSYAELLQRWKSTGAALAQDLQDNTRLGSLPVSLRLTADVLAKHEGALALWTSAALFADGLPEDLLQQLELSGSWPSARQWLARHHVLTRRDGQWHMLPPLARYALEASLVSEAGFDWAACRGPMQSLFESAAGQADSTASSNDALRARAWLMQNFGTLSRLMLHEVGVSQPDHAWLADMHNKLFNHYQFQASISRTLLTVLIRNLKRPASALEILGDLKSLLGRPDEARGLYDKALLLYEKEQDGLGQANTLQSMGELESRLGRPDEARGLYDKALVLYEKEQDGLGQANTLQSMGDQLLKEGQFAKAALVYRRALTLYERGQEPMGMAYTCAELARCAHGQGDFEQRDADLKEGLRSATASGVDSVRRYVMAALVEVTGGREEARAWLEKHMG
jgi:tetratricopeptide (TPR) repeat protein